MKVNLIVIGAGPAGLAAAVEAKKSGLSEVLVIERDNEAGGILEQCIHNGFGLHLFGEELTGPEYAQRFIDEANNVGVKILLNTMVLSLTSHKQVIAVSPSEGLIKYEADAVILAMGCRERTSGALQIPGSRPAGVITAGTAQRYVNKEGYLPGKNIVILGSGDIGLIMARRFTLECANVKLVSEIMPYSGGLNRNIVQCLDDYDIPLLLNTTVTQIHGKQRVTGVTVTQVDENRKPIPETSEYIDCDTLVLSVGLIPENELSLEAGVIIDSVTQGPVVDNNRQTSVPGIYACGNVVHVHDLVDNVTEEARITGKSAAESILQENKFNAEDINIIKTVPEKGVRYIVPQRINSSFTEESIGLFFRVDAIYENKVINVMLDHKIILSRKKNKLLPGEMEHLKLSKKLFTNIHNDSVLTISVQ